MEKWGKDARREAVIVDLDTLVPKDHLLRMIEKVMDYDWLYERLEGHYCFAPECDWAMDCDFDFGERVIFSRISEAIVIQ